MGVKIVVDGVHAHDSPECFTILVITEDSIVALNELDLLATKDGSCVCHHDHLGENLLVSCIRSSKTHSDNAIDLALHRRQKIPHLSECMAAFIFCADVIVCDFDMLPVYIFRVVAPFDAEEKRSGFFVHG